MGTASEQHPDPCGVEDMACAMRQGKLVAWPTDHTEQADAFPAIEQVAWALRTLRQLCDCDMLQCDAQHMTSGSSDSCCA
jgi:hypothetical protein